MEQFYTDKRTGIDYQLVGDYYLPCLKAAASPVIGKYGRMRQRYLKESKHILFIQMLTTDKLAAHLEQVDKDANEMMETLVKQMAEKQGITEELKANDMMKWVGLINNIRNCDEEVVMRDLVYA